MPHPLLQARPTDPFLRFRLGIPQFIGEYVIDGDHVAFLRPDRHERTTWVTALGDDPERIVELIERLRPLGIHGVHVHDHVYQHLPVEVREPDPGHWSMWEFTGDAAAVPDDLPEGLGTLRADDPRITALLRHSESAYVWPGDPNVEEWLGVVADGELVAVGARMPGGGGAAHLVSICTDPQWRGRGLAAGVTAALTSSAIRAGAQGVWLEMFADNDVAARVYGRVGYREVGRYLSGIAEPATRVGA